MTVATFVPMLSVILNAKTLTAHIHVHVITVPMTMVVLVVISINVIPEMIIVTRMFHAVTLLVVTNVLVMMGSTVMANHNPTSMNVSWIFLAMWM